MESKYELGGKQPFKLNGVNANGEPRFLSKRKFCENVNGTDYHDAKKQKLSNIYAHGISQSAVNMTDVVPSSSDHLEKQRKSLPVYACRNRILQEVRQSETLLLMGETGTGKTTQIPQFLYLAGYGQKGVIGVIQPRRLAALTVAKRVSQEYGCKLGDVVGYTVRFEDCTSPQTRIRFMTDGSLLREALSDRLVKKYSVLMLDEAHERTINNDVLFGILKEAQFQRKLKNMNPLKLIIASATMDIDHFGRYFGVRGLYLEGRTYPVKVMHSKKPQKDYLNAVLVTLFEIHRNAPADQDILVFLTGQEEIENMAHQIRSIAKTNNIGGTDVRVFPLYSQLPQNKQMDCFLPAVPNSRKIILATNIAETSITIPGIRFVVDSGLVKQRIFNPESSLEILKVVPISHAQSWQRCGRAGREAEGTCYRTYTKSEMDVFDTMPTPEILRSNISTTVLQLLFLGIDCKSFDFLDKPSPIAIETAYKKLKALGAVKNTNIPELTSLGQQMAAFPLDPKYSKLLLTASSFGCMEEILSLVALLSGENIFVMPAEKKEQAALAHARFESKHGDHLTLLNVYNGFKKIEKVKVWCHDNYLNLRNLSYAVEVRKQLLEIANRLEIEINSCGNNLVQVRKCLLAGLFENIAELQRDNFYLTISGRQKAKIHPSSVFHGKYKPEYIIFSEIVLTERNFLKILTEIDSSWFNEVVPNFSYFNRIRNPMK